MITKALCEELADHAPIVTTWQWPQDIHRKVMLPPNHFLMVRAEHGFIAELKAEDGGTLAHEKSLIRKNGEFFTLFRPVPTPDTHRDLTLKLTLFDSESIERADAPLMQLCAPQSATVLTSCDAGEVHDRNRYAVCTNHQRRAGTGPHWMGRAAQQV